MSDGPLSFQRTWEGFLPPNTVVMAKRSAIPAEEVVPSSLLLTFEAPDSGDPAARALLDKILFALELTSEQYEVLAESPKDSRTGLLVRFSAGETEANRAGVWQANVLTTYSLRAMLLNPGLKKPVWAHLKEALARARETR